jgi:hypothetical protein
MRQADGRACAMAVLSAAATTGSNSIPDGGSISSLAAPSAGLPRPGGSAPPKPPGTRSDGYGGPPGEHERGVEAFGSTPAPCLAATSPERLLAEAFLVLGAGGALNGRFEGRQREPAVM